VLLTDVHRGHARCRGAESPGGSAAVGQLPAPVAHFSQGVPVSDGSPSASSWPPARLPCWLARAKRRTLLRSARVSCRPTHSRPRHPGGSRSRPLSASASTPHSTSGRPIRWRPLVIPIFLLREAREDLAGRGLQRLIPAFASDRGAPSHLLRGRAPRAAQLAAQMRPPAHSCLSA